MLIFFMLLSGVGAAAFSEIIFEGNGFGYEDGVVCLAIQFREEIPLKPSL